jgi:hypothetical protein
MYLVNEALYPYFRNLLISDINNGFYCLLYDETTDKKIEKELQIKIRYFSEVYKVVRNHHLQTFFIKNGTGKTIARCLNHIKIRLYIRESPARAPRAFAQSTKAHNGYNGCPRCIEEGDLIDNRMTFPKVDCAPRPDELFRKGCYEDFYNYTSKNYETCKLVISYSIDYYRTFRARLEKENFVCIFITTRHFLNFRILIWFSNIKSDLNSLNARIGENQIRKTILCGHKNR